MFVTAVTFLVILTVLVLIHEAGHFFVAKLIGVNVEEFGMGLPPRIFAKKIGSTEYSLNWLPIGGFVKLSGEDAEDGTSAKLKNVKQYFFARSKKERAAILCAGVFMNFILAVGITMFLLTSGIQEPSGRVHLEKVVSGSPAAEAKLAVNDIVIKVWTVDALGKPSDPRPVSVSADLIKFAKLHAGEQVYMAVERNGELLPTISMTPRKNPPAGQGAIGVAISDLEVHKYSWREAPYKALVINLTRARDMLTSLGSTLWRLVTLRAPEADVAGPIGIAQVTGQAVKFGWRAVLEFASILSLNLAVLNVLPIPALDGGRLAFVILEKILGRRVRPAFEKSTHQIGMLVLLALIFIVSINDILRLVRG